MTKCPFCGALETPDAFPSASQRFSVYKYQCGTEIVFCGSSDGVVNWDCRNGIRPPSNFQKLVDSMPEESKRILQEALKRLSRV